MIPRWVRKDRNGPANCTNANSHARSFRGAGKSGEFDAARKQNAPELGSPITSCKDEVEFIANYLSGRMSVATRSRFDSHLRNCRDCTAFLQTYRKTIEVTRSFLRNQASLQRPHGLILRRPQSLSR